MTEPNQKIKKVLSIASEATYNSKIQEMNKEGYRLEEVKERSTYTFLIFEGEE